jgi:hypothetical protein
MSKEFIITGRFRLFMVADSLQDAKDRFEFGEFDMNDVQLDEDWEIVEEE